MKYRWMGFALAALLTPALALSHNPAVFCDDCGGTELAESAMQAPAWQGPAARFAMARQPLRNHLLGSQLGRMPFRSGQALIPGEPAVKQRPSAGQALTSVGEWGTTLETCGPGSLGDWLVPEIGEGMELACESHDACYAEGGNESDREACDEQLFLDLVSFGAPIEMATAFYLGVRTAGMWFFTYRGISSWNDPLAGCAYLEVCD